MDTRQRKELESFDKPVRFYETLLCSAANQLTIAGWMTQGHAIELAAIGLFAVLMALSLWMFLVPPRYFATRAAFVVVA